MAKLPTRNSDSEVQDFLRQVAATPAPLREGHGRLIFAMDATASREPAWDRACAIQGEMFAETAALGGLAVQLVYYRGYGECRASRWAADGRELARLMTGVRCLAGRTQIGRVLAHAVKAAATDRVDALVFVGDAMEEEADELCAAAGELGLRKVPVFVFHEGGDPVAARTFREIARLSGGAYCAFDAGSAKQLRDLLAAVAVYAAGGRRALLAYGERAGGTVLRLTQQMAGGR
ncbi:MAG: VWA domain-containing protein [Alphaproteobacteria bacterium]